MFGLGLGFIVNIVVGIALQFIGFLLMPKPPKDAEPSVEDIAEPKAEPGIPIPVVFGTVVVKSLNTLYFGDKRIQKKEEGGGK